MPNEAVVLMPTCRERSDVVEARPNRAAALECLGGAGSSQSAAAVVSEAIRAIGVEAARSDAGYLTVQLEAEGDRISARLHLDRRVSNYYAGELPNDD